MLILGVALWPRSSHALLTIEITQGAETGTPIAVVPFGWDAKQAALPHDVAAVVERLGAGEAGRPSPARG